MSVNRIGPAMCHFHIALARDVVLGLADELQAAIVQATDAAIAAGPLMVKPEFPEPGHQRLHSISTISVDLLHSPDLRDVVLEMMTNAIFKERDKVIQKSATEN